MLYETLSQPKLFFIFLILGILGGFVFDVGNYIKFLFNNKKISNTILDIIEISICLFLIFICNLKFNYGLIRLFPILIFTLSFSIERITLGKIIAKFYLSCYNMFNKINKRLWGKLKNDKTNKTN